MKNLTDTWLLLYSSCVMSNINSNHYTGLDHRNCQSRCNGTALRQRENGFNVTHIQHVYIYTRHTSQRY